jgi:hypothetical protein
MVRFLRNWFQVECTIWFFFTHISSYWKYMWNLNRSQGGWATDLAIASSIHIGGWSKSGIFGFFNQSLITSRLRTIKIGLSRTLQMFFSNLYLGFYSKFQENFTQSSCKFSHPGFVWILWILRWNSHAAMSRKYMEKFIVITKIYYCHKD